MVYYQEKIKRSVIQRVWFLIKLVHRQGTNHTIEDRCVKMSCNNTCKFQKKKIYKILPGSIVSCKKVFDIELISDWSHKGQRVMFFKQCHKNNFFIVSKHTVSFQQKIAGYDIVCNNKLIRWQRLDNKSRNGKVHSFLSELVDKIVASVEFHSFWSRLILCNKMNKTKRINVVCCGFSMGGSVSKLISIALHNMIQKTHLNHQTHILMISQGGFPVCDSEFLFEHVEKEKQLVWLNMFNEHNGKHDKITFMFEPPFANPPSTTYIGIKYTENEMKPYVHFPCTIKNILSPMRIYRYIKELFNENLHMPLIPY